jgi:hypothetical protein
MWLICLSAFAKPGPLRVVAPCICAQNENMGEREKMDM